MLRHAVSHDAEENEGDTIQPGSMVIVYERYDSMKSVTVSQKGRYNNRWGSFSMKVTCTSSAGHAKGHVCVQHRTKVRSSASFRAGVDREAVRQPGNGKRRWWRLHLPAGADA